MKFTTWMEAYNYQMSVAYRDGNGHEFLDQYAETGVENIDTLFFIPDGREVVIVASSDETFRNGHSQEHYGDGAVIQYGVTKNKTWCRIVANEDENGYLEEISFQEFDSLQEMIGIDGEAVVVFKNLQLISHMYDFLNTGLIGDEEEFDEFEEDLVYDFEDDDWEDDYEEDDFNDVNWDNIALEDDDWDDDWEDVGEKLFEDEGEEDEEDDENVYQITYSYNIGEEKQTLTVQGISDAEYYYDDLIKQGVAYVEMTKLMKVHVSYC